MYLHDWKESGLIGMISDFEDIYITKEEYEADVCPIKNEPYWIEKKAKMASVLSSDKYAVIKVLLASYSYEDYQGDAFVLFEREGSIFEVNGSHCSCYGLEEQWEPEATTKEALSHRLEKGTLGNEDWSGNVFAVELRQVLVTL